jgi:plastocyanin
MRKSSSAVLAVVLAGAAITTSTALAAGRTVKVGDDYFVRSGATPTVKVSKGTRVTWRWAGRHTHNVRAYKGPVRFTSSFKDSGTYRRTFKKRGTYRLVCDVHPTKMKMTLKVY